ncbi:MAG: SGNH/GDSL hydrolase family protein [Opitutaceae bacterium]|jgi:lysophospholipase L1-like esterase
MKYSAALSLLGLMIVAVAPLTAQPVEVPATDPLVRYVGRFDCTDAAGPRGTWSASSVALTFTGDSVSVKLKDKGQNFWQVVVDGAPTGVLKLEPGEQVYPVASGLSAGTHTVELVKRTEFFAGATQVESFQLAEGAKLLPTPARAHRIEVIGDSISCGYGNEAPRKEDGFSTATENAWLAYGAVAAREVGADYMCVAWSGKKLWPDNSILDYYDRVLPDAAAAKWDFSTWTPDVVIINLGTNDFNAKANPDEAGWIAAYVAFIKDIRSHYPKAPIYCAVGTMMSDWPPERKPRTVILDYLAKVIEQANADDGPAVHLIDFGVQSQENGLGANWHPSVKTHALMGAQLAQTLKADLGW